MVSIMAATASTPFESLMRIIRIGRLVSGAVGVDFLNPNYRVNWVTYIVISSIVGYFIFTFITIYILFEENWKVLLEVTCMVGSVIQGVAKLMTGILLDDKLRAANNLVMRIYKEYEKKGPDYVDVLHSSCTKIRTVITVIGITYLITGISLTATPFVMMGLTGRRYMIMHFIIPGLDTDTNFGYFATQAAHSICILSACFGLFAGDFFVLVFLTQFFVFADIFKLKVKEINEMMDKNPHQAHSNSDRVSESLIDIVLWHQLYLKYTKICNESTNYLVSVQVSTAGISIVLTIYILLTGDYPGGYLYLILTIYNLYVYCILGTKIETCNDDLVYEIYNINWYNMPVSHQKTMRLMLMEAQSSKLMMVANIKPLTVNTALQITKTIYSICMMMVQFISE